MNTEANMLSFNLQAGELVDALLADTQALRLLVHHLDNGVRILGPTDLASRMAHDASQMYARNVAAFLVRIVDEDGSVAIDLEDPIISGAAITHDGRITHPVVRRRMGLEATT